MLKRKATSYANRPFKKPRQTQGAATYNMFARAGAFARMPAVRRQARGMVDTSTKGVDVNLGLTVLATSTTNGAAVLLNGVAPGSGSYNRVGRKIVNKSVRIKGGAVFSMIPNASGAVNENSLRMVVVWDQQPNSGTIPTWDTIFGVTDQAGNETSNVLAPLRYDNMDRFRVLKEKSWDVQTVPANVVTTGAISQFRTIDEFIPLSDRPSVYSGQSATCTTADISTGALYVYFRCQRSDATAGCIIDPETIARLRYKD